MIAALRCPRICGGVQELPPGILTSLSPNPKGVPHDFEQELCRACYPKPKRSHQERIAPPKDLSRSNNPSILVDEDASEFINWAKSYADKFGGTVYKVEFRPLGESTVSLIHGDPNQKPGDVIIMAHGQGGGTAAEIYAVENWIYTRDQNGLVMDVTTAVCESGLPCQNPKISMARRIADKIGRSVYAYRECAQTVKSIWSGPSMNNPNHVINPSYWTRHPSRSIGPIGPMTPDMTIERAQRDGRPPQSSNGSKGKE